MEKLQGLTGIVQGRRYFPPQALKLQFCSSRTLPGATSIHKARSRLWYGPTTHHGPLIHKFSQLPTGHKYYPPLEPLVVLPIRPYSIWASLASNQPQKLSNNCVPEEPSLELVENAGTRAFILHAADWSLIPSTIYVPQTPYQE